MHRLSSPHDVSTFSELFRGNMAAHGVFEPDGTVAENGKQGGRSYTKQEPVGELLYARHLSGERGLGIVPINAENLVNFGAIDVDDYSGAIDVTVETVRRYSMPAVPFRSKSGGLHLYFFFAEPTKAKEAIEILARFRRALGLPVGTEIFPKQAALGEGIGNWINLPLFGTDPAVRGLLWPEGYSLSETLAYCKKNRRTATEFAAFLDSLPLFDGPPCLQALYLRGATSNRNNYLFALACYYKAKHGEDFEPHVVEANNALANPLPLDELNSSVLKSVRRKEYPYTCSNSPLVELCEKAECKKREFGVGGDGVPGLSYEELTQFEGDEPIYDWKINGVLLRFHSESEIINQTAVRELCMRKLRILPPTLKMETWTRIVNSALANMKTVKEAESDIFTTGTLFKMHLAEFLMKRAPAATKEQLEADRVYLDESLGAYVFKVKNLQAFLIVQKNFRAYGNTELFSKLQELNGKAIKYTAGKKGQIRVWTIPKDAVAEYAEHSADISVEFLDKLDGEEY